MLNVNKNPLYLFVVIFILGLILRFYDLGGVPAGFHRDEAFLGYNAYSILKTGSDINGNFLPLHLESFLFSPAGYSYFSIPFISVFGLNELSVRFASALFGSLTIIVVYLLTLRLFEGKKYDRQIAMLSALFLVISPWHINMSRVATENTVVVFFIALGTLLLLNWFKYKNSIYLVFAFLSFFVTIFTYQAPRAFLPLFIPLLFVIFFGLKNTKKLILPVALFILTIVMPILLVLSSHDLSRRVEMLSIFNHPETQLKLNEQIREEGSGVNPFLTRLYHNKVINYSATFIQNYANHFSYNFLLTDAGLPDRYRVPGFGLIYFLDVIFIVSGLIYLYQKDKKIFYFLAGWIVIVPIGSAMTFDDIPNLQRTLIIFPALSIVIAVGLYGLWNLKYNVRLQVIFRSLLVVVIIYNLSFYLHQYFVHQVNHRPWFRQEGYKELYAKINDLSGVYSRVFITDAQTAPLIFYLFYNSYDPASLQTNYAQIDWDKHSLVFDKYVFGQDCPLHTDAKEDPVSGKSIRFLKSEKSALYVNSGICPDEPDFIKTRTEIKRNDGTVVFRVVEPLVKN